MTIYPSLDKSATTEFDFSLGNIRKQYSKINAYHKVYKLGIALPIIS